MYLDDHHNSVVNAYFWERVEEGTLIVRYHSAVLFW